MEFIENVRARVAKEGADINVVCKTDTLGFSSEAAKEWGISAGSLEVKNDKGVVVQKEVLAAKILLAPASDGDIGYNEKGEEIDLSGQLVLLVSNSGKIEAVNGNVRRELTPFQLSHQLKGNPKQAIDRLTKFFDIQFGEYKALIKDEKTGLAQLRAGVKKALKDADWDDVQYEEKSDLNDFTLVITEKIVSFKFAGGGTLEGCFGLLFDLNSQTAPKDDRITKEINHRKKKALGMDVPTNEAAAEGMKFIPDTDNQKEIETEEEEEEEDEDAE